MAKTTVRTAIFPVAGMGTRFLPATKATPKELLPVIDTPLIQYAINEARDAGIERMVFVSHPSKSAIQRYVMADSGLVQTLRARGKVGVAHDLECAAIDEAEHDVRFVMQDAPLGLGHAVGCAAQDVLPGPVAVILPDDLILSHPGCLSEMIAAYDNTDARHMVATMQVPREDISAYGVLAITSRDGPVVRASGIVEKPGQLDAPSSTAVVGRYILDPTIFEAIRATPPGTGGEIQLTDAIAAGIDRVGLAGVEFSGRRFDCGSKQGMLAAILTLAREDPAYAGVVHDICNPMAMATIAAE